MAINTHFEGKRDLGLIDPRKLTIDPTYNVRDLDKPEAREGLDYLKSLIRATGVQIPLRIREDGDGKLIIVRGHRRHKVVMELLEEGHHIKLVPVVQEPRGTTPADRNWDLIDSNSEQPLTGLERAEALYRQIHVFGWSEEEVLRRTGKTRQWLNQQLDMRAMPEAVKEQVKQGDVSATLAVKLVKEAQAAKDDPEKVAEFLRLNKEENARIRGKHKRHKVTAKTIKRDRERAKPQPTQSAAAAPSTPVHTEPPTALLPPAAGWEHFDNTPATSHVAIAPTPQIARPITGTGAVTDDCPDETISVLAELTRQAHLCVQHNQSDDHPGWWSSDLVEAIIRARDVVERLTGKPMEFETLPDPSSQEEEAA